MKRLEPCGVIPPRITPLRAGLETEPGRDFTPRGGELFSVSPVELNLGEFHLMDADAKVQ